MKNLKYIFALLVTVLVPTSHLWAADDTLVKSMSNEAVLFGVLGTFVLVLVVAILAIVYVFTLNAPQLLKNAKSHAK